MTSLWIPTRQLACGCPQVISTFFYTHFDLEEVIAFLFAMLVDNVLIFILQSMTFHPRVRPFVKALLEHCQRKSIKIDISESVSGIKGKPNDHDRFTLEILHAGSVKLEMYVIFNGDNMSDFDIIFPNDFDFIIWLVRKDYCIVERFNRKEPKSFCKIIDLIRTVWSDYQEHKMNRQQRKINEMVQRMFQELKNEDFSYQVQGCEDFICYQLEFQFRHKTMLPTQKMYLRVSFKVKVEYAIYYDVQIWSSKDLQDLLEEIDYPLLAPNYQSKEESLPDFVNRVSEVVKQKVQLHYDTMQRSFISLILQRFAERVIFICFVTFRKVQLSMPSMDKRVTAIFTIYFSADNLPPTCEVEAKNKFFGKDLNTELSTVELYENQINYEELLEYFCQKMKEAEELVQIWNDGLYE